MSSIARFARRVVERVAHHRGYELKMRDAPPRGFDSFLEYVRDQGLSPRTVFDVGVGRGTPWLYSAFPDAHHVLIEPQREFEPCLRKICEDYDAEYHLVGAAASEGQSTMHRRESDLTGSSFRLDTAEEAARHGPMQMTDVALPVRPLDSFADRPPPFVLKIDTEGYELNVLQGASQILAQTELLLTEVAVQPRHEGEADLGELSSLLRSHGLRLFDIPVLTQRSVGGPLAYMDVAFAKCGGVLVPN